MERVQIPSTVGIIAKTLLEKAAELRREAEGIQRTAEGELMGLIDEDKRGWAWQLDPEFRYMDGEEKPKENENGN